MSFGRNIYTFFVSLDVCSKELFVQWGADFDAKKEYH